MTIRINPDGIFGFARAVKRDVPVHIATTASEPDISFGDVLSMENKTIRAAARGAAANIQIRGREREDLTFAEARSLTVIGNNTESQIAADAEISKSVEWPYSALDIYLRLATALTDDEVGGTAADTDLDDYSKKTIQTLSQAYNFASQENLENGLRKIIASSAAPLKDYEIRNGDIVFIGENNDDPLIVNNVNLREGVTLKATDLNSNIDLDSGKFSTAIDLNSGKFSTAINLTAGYAIGVKTVVVDDATGAEPGMSVRIGSGGGAETLIIESADVGAKTLTFTTATEKTHGNNSGVTQVNLMYPAGTRAVIVDSVSGAAIGQKVIVGTGATAETMIISFIDTSAKTIWFSEFTANAHADNTTVVQTDLKLEAGSISVVLDSVTGAAGNNYIAINPGGANEEWLRIRTVTTASKTLTFTTPTQFEHADNESVREISHFEISFQIPQGETTYATTARVDKGHIAGETYLKFPNLTDMSVGDYVVFDTVVPEVANTDGNEVHRITALHASDKAITIEPGITRPIHAKSVVRRVFEGDTIKVAAVTNIEKNDVLKVGSGAYAEYMTVDSVDTTAKTVTFTEELKYYHAHNELVKEVLAQAGQKDVLLSSATGFSANDWIVLSPGEPEEEVAQIDSISTNTLTLEADLKNHHLGGAVVKECAVVNLYFAGGE